MAALLLSLEVRSHAKLALEDKKCVNFGGNKHGTTEMCEHKQGKNLNLVSQCR